jgi:hypothetical protein
VGVGLKGCQRKESVNGKSLSTVDNTAASTASLKIWLYGYQARSWDQGGRGLESSGVGVSTRESRGREREGSDTVSVCARARARAHVCVFVSDLCIAHENRC